MQNCSKRFISVIHTSLEQHISLCVKYCVIHHKSWLLITRNGERNKLLPSFEIAYNVFFAIQPPPYSMSLSCFETKSTCTFTPNNLSPTSQPCAIQYLRCHSVSSTLKMDIQEQVTFCDSAISSSGLVIFQKKLLKMLSIFRNC